MPELPEVETVRRTLERVLVGHTISEVELPDDPYLLSKHPAEPIREALKGARVTQVGRLGKTWWLELKAGGFVIGHLGMSGWIRELNAPTIRLKEHGKLPLEDAEGRPKFLRMSLTADTGRAVVFTDGRRLGRLWWADELASDPMIRKLGRDAWLDLPGQEQWQAHLARRKAPIKALLLDQTFVCGIGNWIADEVLYHARIAPQRPGATLTSEEIVALRREIKKVIDKAVSVGADEHQYPEDWLFHVRWGGARGPETVSGQTLIRETVGGRTTAWVPGLQK